MGVHKKESFYRTVTYMQKTKKRIILSRGAQTMYLLVTAFPQ